MKTINQSVDTIFDNLAKALDAEGYTYNAFLTDEGYHVIVNGGEEKYEVHIEIKPDGFNLCTLNKKKWEKEHAKQEDGDTLKAYGNDRSAKKPVTVMRYVNKWLWKY